MKDVSCRFVNYMLHKREGEKGAHEETSIYCDTVLICIGKNRLIIPDVLCYVFHEKASFVWLVCVDRA